MTGTTLGHFEIGAKLGEGGMGAVYRARDRHLGRDVAIKVLPADFTSAPDRLIRFEREAHMLASLNHPNVATLYGFEEREGLPFLVMELVAGQTLRDRIAGGALLLADALAIATQMADGLEAAHAAGVVHRDLKPANVMIAAEGRVKLLDFGVAKAFDPMQAAAESPTLTRDGTAVGVVVGTVSYMSPEQARGAAVDKRTDIWAFGCCLFEMVTGQRAFDGETATDTIAQIVGSEPDWRRLDGRVPARVRDLVAACLTKNPRSRLHDIADARIQLERALDEPVASPPPTWRAWHAAAWATALAAGAAGVAVWALTRSPAASSTPVIRTVIPLRVSGTPEGVAATLDVQSNGMGTSLAISPDGQMVAYRMRLHGVDRLYVRRLDQLQATAVEGSGGAALPLFTADARYLAFVRDGGLFRTALTGGGSTRIADGIGIPRGVDWCGDQVVFSPDVSRGLFKMSVGGSPTPLTSLDPQRREKSHRFPHVLPGCQDVLFTIGTSTTESWSDGDLAVASMATGQYRVVLHGGVHARYSPSGHIVYNRGGTLHAAAFDLERLEVTGPPVPVVTEVMSVTAGGWAEFALAENGTLVYAPGRSKMAERQLVRIDRRGRAEPFPVTPREFASFRLSPDGLRVAAHLYGGIGSIWLFDIERGAATRWTTEWDNVAPIWAATSRQIIFASPRQSVFDLYRQPVDGGAAPERIAATEFTKVATSWSPDGKTVVYQEQGNIFVLPLAPGSKPTPFVNTRATEQSAAFSPDGAWLAYVSDESGRNEVFVRRFPDGADRRPVSVDGGTNPVWKPDGRELFYRNGPRMMAVAITDARNMTLARPQLLYERRFGVSADNGFDVTPDGLSFVDLDDAVAEPPPTELVVVQQFASELRRLAPAR